MHLFMCQGCGAKYAIIRRQKAPAEAPACEVCERAFPATERGDWLAYQRADRIVLSGSA
jgi:hypothetical protein